MILVIQTKASDIITLLAGDGREQVFDRKYRFRELTIEDCTVDEVRLNIFPLERIKTNITRCVCGLTKMYTVVFFGYKTNDVSWLDHFASVC